MAGLDPAIHAFGYSQKDVDASRGFFETTGGRGNLQDAHADASAAPTGTDRRLADILRVLQANAERLRGLGVRYLSIFGSTARGTARPDSDVDLLIELAAERKIDLFNYAGIVGEIQRLIAHPIDVARRDKLKPEIVAEALGDEIRAF
jgi:predicted nucleotidyltransferase